MLDKLIMPKIDKISGGDLTIRFIKRTGLPTLSASKAHAGGIRLWVHRFCSM